LADGSPHAPPCALDRHSYKRIPPDHSKGADPLGGLYLGSFGPHGPELLNLTRAVVDDEEMVQAVKLTGDANVPAGSVSFRAKTGRKHRLEARDVYPDELGIMARWVWPPLAGGRESDTFMVAFEEGAQGWSPYPSIPIQSYHVIGFISLPCHARYKGEGRVAQRGFTQPRWVEGELLVFNAKGNTLTGGAELGFVWAVPGEKRFLILLNRVDLGDVK